jgi:predicted O-methyltransferase YrrM
MNATIVADRFVGVVDRAPEERTANLALPNIRFVEMNSLMLVNSTRRFDAVWLDGDHTNPVVTLDIANALRLVRPGGLLAMDDVRLPGAWFGVRGSDETWQALESLRKAGVVTYGLVHKRLTENALLITEVRKYIAVVTRVSDRNPLDLGDEDPYR